MAGELVVMSTREIDRLGVIRAGARAAADAGEGRASCWACRRSQVARLCDAYERDGAAGLVSRKRGPPSNRKVARQRREPRSWRWSGSATPTSGRRWSREKLRELHGISSRRGDRPPDPGCELGSGCRVTSACPKPHQPRFRRDVPGRAGPDRRLRARLVRGPRARAARCWSSSTTPPAGSCSCASSSTESAFAYFEATGLVPAAPRQAGGLLQRQAQHLPRGPEGTTGDDRASPSSAGPWPSSTSTSSAPTRPRPKAGSSG